MKFRNLIYAIVIILVIISVSWNLLKNNLASNDLVTITQMAIAQKNVNLCDTIKAPLIGIGGESEGKPISMCYAEYAKAFPRQQVCSGFLPRTQTGDQVRDNWEYTHYFQCVQAESQSQNDEKICLQINDSKWQSYCVATIGMKNGDKNACSILSNISDKNLCLSQF